MMWQRITAVCGVVILLLVVVSGWVRGGTTAVAQPLPPPASQMAQNGSSEDVCLGNNLLANPSFEVGSYSPYIMAAPGHPDCQTWSQDQPNQYCERVKLADEWHPWWRNSPRTEVWMNIQPEYVPSTPQEMPPRVRSGEKSQHYFSFWSTMEAGLYQQVAAVPGGQYCFSAWGHAWSSRETLPGWLSDPNDHGELHQRVGIDPTGGTDWSSPNIIWSDARMQYDVFGQFWITGTAQANQVTVFMWSRPNIPVKHNDVYWDDAVLTVQNVSAVGSTAVNQMSAISEPERITYTIPIRALPGVTWQVTAQPGGTLLPEFSPTAGNGDGVLQVTIDSDGYALGSYTAVLAVAFDEFGTPSSAQIQLTLWVVEEVHRGYGPLVVRN